MAGLSPLTVVSWSEFMADPTLMYNLFWRCPSTGNFQFDPATVNVMAGANKRTLEVKTVEDLSRLENDLMSKPILLDLSTMYSSTTSYVVVRVTTTWRGSFAVLLNPLHPLVRAPMAEMFRKGLELISTGAKFCLEFDLGPCIEAWYTEMLGDAGGCYNRTKSSLTRFYITNSTTYQHCFDCNPLWFVLGFSCWLLSAPCYLTHRACTVTDEVHKFNVPVVMRTPLSRDRVLEVLPGNNSETASANRQVLINRTSQHVNVHGNAQGRGSFPAPPGVNTAPPGGGPYRGGYPGPPPPTAPPGVRMPGAPPPYSPAPYAPPANQPMQGVPAPYISQQPAPQGPPPGFNHNLI